MQILADLTRYLYLRLIQTLASIDRGHSIVACGVNLIVEAEPC